MANKNYVYTNNAESVLLNSVGPTDAMITVPGGQGARFPNPTGGQSFMLTIEDTSGNIEIVECTGRTTDTLTVVRGREGTLAQAWSSSTGIYQRVTAGILSQIDWTKFAGQPNGVATLDSTSKIPIAQFDTPLQTFGDNRYNLKLGYTPVNKAGDAMTGQLNVPLLLVQSTAAEADLYLISNNSDTYRTYFYNNSGNGNAGIALTNATGAFNGNVMLWNRQTGATTMGFNVGIGGAPSCPLDVYTANGRLLIRSSGANPTIDAVNAANNAFVAMSFTGSTFFFNGGPLNIVNGGLTAAGAVTINTNGATNGLTINDPSSPNLKLQNGGAGSKYIRVSSNQLQFVNNAYSAVITTMDDAGNWNMLSGSVTAASVTDGSDIRIKDNVRTMGFEEALDIVLRTRVVRFFNKLSQREEFGVIADEQLDVSPEIVFEGTDEEKMKSVAYSRLTAPLIVVLQGLRERGII